MVNNCQQVKLVFDKHCSGHQTCRLCGPLQQGGRFHLGLEYVSAIDLRDRRLPHTESNEISISSKPKGCLHAER